jgi:3-hydroxyisobutyrate dehydrogenase-like beta-hydroxyacid dehydrogenase
MVHTAFIGLGTMGYPMAGHLVGAGHEVAVYNRTATTAGRWGEQFGGRVAATPAEAARDADVVFVCVGADDDVRTVLLGADGALEALAEGAVVVDHTTASAALATELDRECRSRGLRFVDAPISGGQSGAENGTLSVMCGGDPADFARVEPVMAAYGANIVLIGPAGSGQRTKMVNQILCAGAIQGAAEALAFGQRAGLDMEKVLSAVTKGAASSWYLNNRGETMVRDEFDFGFAVDWMAKDLGLVADEAERLGAEAPLTAMVAEQLARRQRAGDNRMDATAIIRNYTGD